MYEKQNDRKECTYSTVSGLLLNPASASYSGDPVKVRTPNTIYVLHYLFEASIDSYPIALILRSLRLGIQLNSHSWHTLHVEYLFASIVCKQRKKVISYLDDRRTENANEKAIRQSYVFLLTLLESPISGCGVQNPEDLGSGIVR